jgi:hypothetical protein
MREGDLTNPEFAKRRGWQLLRLALLVAALLAITLQFDTRSVPFGLLGLGVVTAAAFLIVLTISTIIRELRGSE